MNDIRFNDGKLYFSSELCEKYFRKIDAVALLKQDDRLLLVPVQPGGGGLLLKLINAKGDRVILVEEFFRNHGIDMTPGSTFEAEWDSDKGGLILTA